MFIFLFVIPLCEAAAGPDSKGKQEDTASWDQAVQGIQNIIQQETELFLHDRQITAIPSPLGLPNLHVLALEHNLITDVPENLGLPNLDRLLLSSNQIVDIPGNLPNNLRRLHLDNNRISVIPESLELLLLERLYLSKNQIGHVNPQRILAQFPMLTHLFLNQNPLTQKNVDELKAAAQQANRHITITARNIGKQCLPEDYGGDLKPAKR